MRAATLIDTQSADWARIYRWKGPNKSTPAHECASQAIKCGRTSGALGFAAKKMSPRSLFLAATSTLAALAAAGTVPETNVTASTRACQPPHDAYPFCDTSLSLDARVKDLVSRIADADVPPQLTARHGGGGSPGPMSNISAIGLPEWDWGLNAIHGVQSSCVRGAADGKTYCATSFMNPVNVRGRVA
jgi:hypothetical protein